jgi:hypothetical protein
MNAKSRSRLLLSLLLLAGGLCAAQGWRHRGSREGVVYTEDGVAVDEHTVKTAREVANRGSGAPIWTNAPGLEPDVFTFARIIRDRSDHCSPTAGEWITDFPDSDLNLSYRLQQLTTIKTDPNGRTLRLTDPDLVRYPWIYMVEPGSLELRDEEVPILRNYLLNGGFLMVDDFWGEVQWRTFQAQMKRVFPERDFVELPMDHPIFHAVFPLDVPKNQLQIPNFRQGIRSQYDGVTWENHDGEECRDVHIRALNDDQGHIMVLACHNTDNGDGWEREGTDEYFFRQFSEKRAFPLAINIVFFAMTH